MYKRVLFGLYFYKLNIKFVNIGLRVMQGTKKEDTKKILINSCFVLVASPIFYIYHLPCDKNKKKI